MEPARRATPYELLQALPEVLTGEILNGQLHTQPRPSGPHARVASRVDRTIGRSYDDGIDGPGGWWIFVEPELHLVRDTEIAVPDLAGWRRTRMPNPPEDQRFEVVPDWICEILSPSTESKDRRIKMPLYAHYAVAFAWIVDPIAQTLEAYQLEHGDWHEIGRFSGAQKAAVPPFEAVTLHLDGMWLPKRQDRQP
jgi:Uma2 family endonuclease